MKRYHLLRKLTLISLLTTVVFANYIGDEVVATKHNKHLTISQVAEIQPGLGTIMMEFGHRFYIAYYAAKAKNWGLAKYEIKELLEAQEVVELTRPLYTKALKEFENKYIKNLLNAIEAKDIKRFELSFTQTTNACNSCHKATGHAYIYYQLPSEAPKFLRLKLQ